MNETEAERVPFFGNYDRNLYGIAELTYEWLNDTSIVIGSAEQVVSTDFAQPKADTWKIVSNPVHDFLSIQLIDNQREITFTIYDLNGKPIRTFNANGNQPIYVNELAAGSYLLSGDGHVIVFQKL